MPPVALTYAGTVIHQRDERLCLTDMWKAAGADPQQAPAKWRTLPSTKAFVEHVELTIGKSDSELFRVVQGGKSPGTWAHWQVGLAYAKYLSPEFHAWCNQVVRERMEGRPTEAAMTPRQFGGIVKSVSHAELVAFGAALRAELAAIVGGYDPAQTIVADFQPMLDVLVGQKVGSKKRRGLSSRCSRLCARWLIGQRRGADIRLSRETKRYLFQSTAVEEWLRAEGHAVIQAHKVALAGQTIMQFRSGPQLVPPATPEPDAAS